MKYTILSIDDTRKEYTDKIKTELSEWDRLEIQCVNGNNRVELDEAIEEFGVHIAPEIKVGQAGGTLSTLRALSADDEPLLILNDDAVLCDNFIDNFVMRTATLPQDFDVFTCFIPRDHDRNFYTGVEPGLHNGLPSVVPMNQYYQNGHPMFESNGTTCKSYMRYGGVALYFSSKGKEKYKLLPHINRQADDILYLAGHQNKLKVYASVPNLPDLAYITGDEKSLCQETEFYHQQEFGDINDNR